MSDEKRRPSPEEQQAALSLVLESLSAGSWLEPDVRRFLAEVGARMAVLESQLNQPDRMGNALSKPEMARELRDRLEYPVVDAVAIYLLRSQELLRQLRAFPSVKELFAQYSALEVELGNGVDHLDDALKHLGILGGEIDGKSIADARTRSMQHAAFLEVVTQHLGQVISQQRPEDRSSPEVFAERLLVCGLLAIPDGSVPTETLVEGLLPGFVEELSRQGREAILSVEELTVPESIDEDSPKAVEILKDGPVRRPLDIEEAYLHATLHYRGKPPSGRTAGFLSDRQVAALLIVLGLHAPHSSATRAKASSAGDLNEDVGDAVERVAGSIVRERLREACADGRTTRRRRETGPKKPRKGKATESPKPRSNSKKKRAVVGKKRKKTLRSVAPTGAELSKSNNDQASLDMMGTPPPK